MTRVIFFEIFGLWMSESSPITPGKAEQGPIKFFVAECLCQKFRENVCVSLLVLT